MEKTFYSAYKYQVKVDYQGKLVLINDLRNSWQSTQDVKYVRFSQWAEMEDYESRITLRMKNKKGACHKNDTHPMVANP